MFGTSISLFIARGGKKGGGGAAAVVESESDSFVTYLGELINR